MWGRTAPEVRQRCRLGATQGENGVESSATGMLEVWEWEQGDGVGVSDPQGTSPAAAITRCSAAAGQLGGKPGRGMLRDEDGQKPWPDAPPLPAGSPTFEPGRVGVNFVRIPRPRMNDWSIGGVRPSEPSPEASEGSLGLRRRPRRVDEREAPKSRGYHPTPAA